jgi:Protein of unknown function (DUF3500)
VARGFALIKAPDASQQQQAVRGAQGTDLVLGPNPPMRSVVPEGIQAPALNADQQAKLLDLIGEDVDLLNEQNAAARMAEIRSALADTCFAWYGPTADGSASYYRVQGPALWIEFAPQAGGGSGRGGLGPGDALTLNHVHSIDRDPTDEYGARCSGQYIDLAPPSPRQDEAAWDRGTGRHT